MTGTPSSSSGASASTAPDVTEAPDDEAEKSKTSSSERCLKAFMILNGGEAKGLEDVVEDEKAELTPGAETRCTGNIAQDPSDPRSQRAQVWVDVTWNGSEAGFEAIDMGQVVEEKTAGSKQD